MDGDGVGLVVVDRVEAPLARDLEHHVFARIALASPVLLDRAGGDGLVGDAVGLAPGHERCQQAPVDVPSGHAGRPLLDLLECHPVDATRGLQHLI